MDERKTLLAEYDDHCDTYGAFCKQLDLLIHQLLDQSEIQVHSITSRLKDRSSYEKKIARESASYDSIDDVTDVAGIRIITYLADQVDQIGKVIQDEFEIDEENTVDKRRTLEPDRFGYLSVHFVVRLADERKKLSEYSPFSDLTAEIQVRSILQHAWAEIEHDLGYKSAEEVPRTIRREFSRLAGLLELADDEFIRIREELVAYGAEVTDRIATEPENVTLDRVSLIDFVTTDPIVNELDQLIAEAHQFELILQEDNIAAHVKRLAHFNVRTIADVKDLLDLHHDQIAVLNTRWVNQALHEPGKKVPRSISIMFLLHILSSEGADRERIQAYLEKFNIISNIPDRDLATDLEEFARHWSSDAE